VLKHSDFDFTFTCVCYWLQKLRNIKQLQLIAITGKIQQMSRIEDLIKNEKKNVKSKYFG
jgi:hypothetical protein